MAAALAKQLPQIENTAVVAPIPMASMNTAVVAKQGDFSKRRIATLSSWENIMIAFMAQVCSVRAAPG